MADPIAPHTTPDSGSTGPEYVEINRFVSMLSGALHAFYLYRQDNKAIDEIMENLSKRYQLASQNKHTIKLGVTNRSIFYEGNPIGSTEVTRHLSILLVELGFKEIIFRPPLQSRHFFQILHIISNKDPEEAKFEKLAPFIGDGDDKPITLVPLLVKNSVLRLSDALIQKRLELLFSPTTPESVQFLKSLEKLSSPTLPDLLTFICVKAEILPNSTKAFLRNLTDAAREGYFPTQRYLNVLPLPTKLKQDLGAQIQIAPPARPRKKTSLGQRFVPASRPSKNNANFLTAMTTFNEQEAIAHQLLRLGGGQTSALQDLELAEALLGGGPSDILLGMRFLLRIMGDKNAVNVQEKALKIGMDMWTKLQDVASDPNFASILSMLRQHLTSISHITLLLFPLRNNTVESDAFTSVVKSLLSLGNAVGPALLASLESEQDRSMRKKLCHLIACMAREIGIQFVLDGTTKNAPFLIRNLVMVLGDLRQPKALPVVIGFLNHPQKIVRIEAIRSLCKINDETAMKSLTTGVTHFPDEEGRKIALDLVVFKKMTAVLPDLMRSAKDSAATPTWRRALYTAIGTLGGPQAKEFLKSQKKETGLFSRVSADEKEDQELIKTLLARMGA